MAKVKKLNVFYDGDALSVNVKSPFTGAGKVPIR